MLLVWAGNLFCVATEIWGSEALFQCYGLIPHASSSIFLHHKFHTIYLVLLFDCSKEDVLLPSRYLLKLSLFSKNDNGWYQNMYEQSCKLFHLPQWINPVPYCKYSKIRRYTERLTETVIHFKYRSLHPNWKLLNHLFKFCS